MVKTIMKCMKPLLVIVDWIAWNLLMSPWHGYVSMRKCSEDFDVCLKK